MEDQIWQTTAQMYSSLFEKPKMTETLLKKPPVKYIVDIVIQTSKVTGFAEGLFKEEELTKEYLQTYKEAKFDFFRKIFELTSKTLKEEIDVNPVKIAAGLEPEKTNMLLQAIYRAAMKHRERNEQKITAPKSKKLEEKLKIEEKIEIKEEATDDFFEKTVSEVARSSKIDDKLESEKQIKDAQNLIQTLTQNLQPLNKSIDYVDENIESMNKEMQFWRGQYLESKTQYHLEVCQTDEQLEPLQNMLAELEKQINKKKEKIQAVKAQTLQNELRSRQLLYSAVSTK